MVVLVSLGVVNGFPLYTRVVSPGSEYHSNEYPTPDPADAVAVSVVVDPLPTVVGRTVTVGSGYTTTEADFDFALDDGDAPEVTPMSVKMK